MSRIRIHPALVMLPLAMAGQEIPGAEIPELVEQLRKNVAIGLVYKADEEMTFTLSDGQSALLKIPSNSEGLKECLIGTLKDQFGPGSRILFIYGVHEDGSISGGGSDVSRFIGAVRQMGPASAWLAVGWWTVEKTQVHVRLRMETNRVGYLRAYRECLQANPQKMSIQINDWGPLIGQGNMPDLDIDETQRVVGFVRLWSEVKYNFAFFDKVPDLDWDKVLEDYLPKVKAERTVTGYYRCLQEMIARLHDGHTGVWGPDLVWTGRVSRPALLIRPVEGKACIVGVGDDSELKGAGLAPGDVITHVDDRAVEEVLKKDLYPVTFASTPQGRDHDAYERLLDGVKNTQVRVRVKRGDDAGRDVVLSRSHGRGGMPGTNRPILEERRLEGGVVYVALNSFDDEAIVSRFGEIFADILDAKGLILDVRNNGGGSSGHGWAIVSHLTDKALAGPRWKTRRYVPAFRAWGRKEEWHQGEPTFVQPREGGRYLGPLVVLIGPATCSAAEDFLIPLHVSGRARLVGQKTAGTTGQPLLIDMPMGGLARICTKRDTYPDGREFVGVGVVPDIEVVPTLESIASGRDLALERAVELLNAGGPSSQPASP